MKTMFVKLKASGSFVQYPTYEDWENTTYKKEFLEDYKKKIGL